MSKNTAPRLMSAPRPAGAVTSALAQLQVTYGDASDTDSDSSSYEDDDSVCPDTDLGPGPVTGSDQTASVPGKSDLQKVHVASGSSLPLLPKKQSRGPHPLAQSGVEKTTVISSKQDVIQRNKADLQSQLPRITAKEPVKSEHSLSGNKIRCSEGEKNDGTLQMNPVPVEKLKSTLKDSNSRQTMDAGRVQVLPKRSSGQEEMKLNVNQQMQQEEEVKRGHQIQREPGIDPERVNQEVHDQQKSIKQSSALRSSPIKTAVAGSSTSKCPATKSASKEPGSVLQDCIKTQTAPRPWLLVPITTEDSAGVSQGRNQQQNNKLSDGPPSDPSLVSRFQNTRSHQVPEDPRGFLKGMDKGGKKETGMPHGSSGLAVLGSKRKLGLPVFGHEAKKSFHSGKMENHGDATNSSEPGTTLELEDSNTTLRSSDLAACRKKDSSSTSAEVLTSRQDVQLPLPLPSTAGKDSQNVVVEGCIPSTSSQSDEMMSPKVPKSALQNAGSIVSPLARKVLLEEPGAPMDAATTDTDQPETVQRDDEGTVQKAPVQLKETQGKLPGALLENDSAKVPVAKQPAADTPGNASVSDDVEDNPCTSASQEGMETEKDAGIVDASSGEKDGKETGEAQCQEEDDNDDALSLGCDAEDLLETLDDNQEEESAQPSKKRPGNDVMGGKSQGPILKLSPGLKRTSSSDLGQRSQSETEKGRTGGVKAVAPTRPQDQRASRSSPPPNSQQHTSSRGPEDKSDAPSGRWVAPKPMNRDFRCGDSRSGQKYQDHPRFQVPPDSNTSRQGPFSQAPNHPFQNLPVRSNLQQRLGNRVGPQTPQAFELQQTMRNGPSAGKEYLMRQLRHRQTLLQLQQMLPSALRIQLGAVANHLDPSSPHADMPVLLRQLQVLMEAVIRLHKQQQESEGALQKQRQIIRHYQRAFLIAKKGGPLSMRNNGSNEQSASSSDGSTSPDIHAGPASSMHRADILKRPMQGTRSAPSDFTRLEECSMLKRRRMSMEASAPGILGHPPQVSAQCGLSAQDARRVVMAAGRAPNHPGDREFFPQPRLGKRPPDDRMFHQVPPCPPEMHQDGPPPLPPYALIRRPAFEHGQEARLPRHIKDNSFQPRRSHPQVEDCSDQAASRATAPQLNESNQFSDDKSTNGGGQREPSMQVVPLRQQAPTYCHPEIGNSDKSTVDRRHAPSGQDQSFEWISRSNGHPHPDMLRLRANRSIIDYYHGISGEGHLRLGRGNYREFQSGPPTVFPPNRGEMQLLATSASPTLRIMDAVKYSQEVRGFLRLCQLASREQCPKGLRSLCQEAFRQQCLP